MNEYADLEKRLREWAGAHDLAKRAMEGLSDAGSPGSWYDLSEVIRNDRMGEVPTLSEVTREHGPKQEVSE